jgi:hypothetical protein
LYLKELERKNRDPASSSVADTNASVGQPRTRGATSRTGA